GIFDGEHYFRLDGKGDDATRFVHGERFTGFLVPIFALVGQFNKIESAFVDMNEALKARVEGVQK
ncbi:MAG: SRPBCC domain-containing protein, partial [SAR202 cluster bacterium]|nr:SRPBCC domain-containing protein [SAR202 cluster bacterium]